MRIESQKATISNRTNIRVRSCQAKHPCSHTDSAYLEYHIICFFMTKFRDEESYFLKRISIN